MHGKSFKLQTQITKVRDTNHESQ